MSYSRSSYKSSASSYRYTREGAGTDDTSFTRSSLTSSSIRSSSRYGTESDSTSFSAIRRTSGLDSDTSLYSSSVRRTSGRTSAGDEDYSYRRLASSRGGEDISRISSSSSYRVEEPETPKDDDFQVSLYRLSSRDDDFPSVFRRPSRDEDFPSAFKYTRGDEDSSSLRRVSEDSGYQRRTSVESTRSRSSYSARTAGAAYSFITAEEEEPVEAAGHVYEAILDYSPAESEKEGLALKEGQRVDVVDSSSSRRWRVRTRGEGDQQEGYVPSCYLERVPSQDMDPAYLEARDKREAIVRELVETEADFARDMQYVVNNYILEPGGATMPRELRDLRDLLFNNFKAISDFHNNVLIKGVQYYAGEPAKLGKTFLRLERDFDMHTKYCREEPLAQQTLATTPLKEYYDALGKMLHDEKPLSEHLKLPIQRINDYQLLFKELIKYSARMKESTTDLEKALEFMKAIPQRVSDLEYIHSMQGYTGNLHKLGRIIKHDRFEIIEPNQPVRERYVFLFKGRIFVTDQRRITADKSAYIIKNIIKLQDVEITEADHNKLEIKKNAPGFPIILRASTSVQRNDWLQEIKSPQTFEDLGEDEPKLAEEEEVSKTAEVTEDLEEMNTAATESLRSGSITSFEGAIPREPSAPKITKPLEDVEISQGSTIMLDFKAAGFPLPSIVWYKDGVELKPSDTIKFLIEEDDTYSLVLKNTTTKDLGLYKAIITNEHGTAETECYLSVTSPPKFKAQMKDMSVMTDEPVKFEVDVDGSPKPEIKWLKDGVELGEGARLKVFRDASTCTLLIEQARVEDSGTYACTATNTCGSLTTTSHLQVKESPKFIEELTDLEEQEGQDITLKAKVTGSPKPIITWLKDGVQIKADNKHIKMEEEKDGSCILKLLKLTQDDVGCYSCQASNDLATVETKGKLSVGGSPTFTEGLVDQEVEEEETLELGVKFAGTPTPSIKWFIDGIEIKESANVKISTDKKSSTLRIKKASSSDAGSYSCEATNKVGKESTQASVSVKEKKKEETAPAKITQGLKSAEVKEGEDAIFAIKFAGKPQPEVKWLKDDTELQEDEKRVKITREDSETFQLCIEKVTAEDAGEYACELSNSSGSDRSAAKLVVKEEKKKVIEDTAAAKITKGFKDVEIKEGEDATFEINYTGKPKPTVTFLKDNETLNEDFRTQIVEESEECTKLIIEQVTIEDMGKYTCQVSNSAGKDSCSGKLVVKEKKKEEEKIAAKVLQGLENVEVMEGEDVKLKVMYTGKPKPDVTFYKDDKQIVEKDRIRIIEESTEVTVLEIEKVTMKDQGNYSCEVSNERGTDKSTGKLIVTEEKETAKITKKLANVEVSEGQDAFFTINFCGKPHPKVKWTKDGSELKTDKRVRVVEDSSDSHTLVIEKVTTDDRGEYGCTVENDSGKDSSSATLKVKEEKEGAKITKGLKDVKVKEGKDASFTVKLSGKPRPTVKWLKDEAELSLDKRVKVVEEAWDSLTLVIQKTTQDDMGTYSCRVENEAGKDSSSAKLNVEEEKEAAKITKGLKDVNVKEGEDASFSLKLSGKPKPAVKWFKDGAELKLTKRVKVIEEAWDSLTLVIQKATQDDKGRYSCTITNEAGEDSSSATLVVEEEKEGAKIVKGLKDVEVKEGEDASFTLKISGKPSPTTTWFKDGAELKLDKRIKVVEEAWDSLTLVIQKATKEDKGTYSCKVQNEAGQDSSSATLIVEEATEAAKIVKKLKDVEVQEGEDASFTVKLSGKPRPKVKWTKDGAELTLNKRVKVVEEAWDSLTLVILNSTLEDKGKYTCTVENEAGKDSTTAELDVLEEQQEAKIVQGLVDVEIEEGEKAEFYVKLSGKPRPKVKWLKDGSILTLSKRVKVVEESWDSRTLIIQDATQEDKGTYTCKVENEAGEDSTAAKLTIKEKVVEEAKEEKKPEATEAAKIVKKLKDVEVQEGEDASFTVKLSGKPRPKVKWTKDGAELTLDNRVKVVEEAWDSLTLVILNSTLEDKGKYTCTVENEAGKDSTSATLDVLEEQQEAKIVQGLQDVEVQEGEKVEFHVKLSGKPHPKVKWLKDGSILTLSKRVKVVEESWDSRRLVIQDAAREDRGTYTCKVENEAGEDSTSAKLTVKEKVAEEAKEEKKPEEEEAKEAAKIVKTMKDVEIMEGEYASFSVKLSGKPRPSVKWTKDGEELTINKRVKVIQETWDSLTLVIQKTILDDKGTYGCIVKNEAGEDSTSARLIVKKEAKEEEVKKEEMEKPLEEKKEKKEEKIMKEEKAEEKALEEEELKGEKEMVKEEKIEEEKVKEEKLKEKVEEKKIKDEVKEEKIQEVEVKPTKEEEIKPEKIKIKEKEEEVKPEKVKEEEKPKVKEEEEKERARIVKGLKDVEVSEGEDASFTVKLAGKPKPLVKWEKDGAELVLDKRVKVIEEAWDSLTLVIQNTTDEDKGTYTLKVENEAGKDSSSASLTVKVEELKKKEEEDKVPVKIIKSLEDATVTEGEDVSFTIKFVGKPQPTSKWTKDGASLTLVKDRIKVVEEASDTLTLVIKQAARRDAGEYACELSNEVGKASSAATLTVRRKEIKEEINKPYFERDLKDTECFEGDDNVDFKVTVKGKPAPSVKWILNGKELESKDNLRIISDELSGSHRLLVKSATIDLTGTLVCKAQNEHGEAETSCNFTVKIPLKIVEGLKDVEISEGQTLKMSVTYRGHPVPEVTWLKAGQDLSTEEGVTITSVPGSTTLDIARVLSKLSGLITCRLSSPYGSLSTTGSLTVAVPPKFDQGLENKEIWAEENVTFEVKVSGVPYPKITWLKEGKSLEGSDKVSIESKDDVHRLRITSATAVEAGSYTCQAVNKAGQATQSAKLVVKCPEDYEVPTFIKRLGEQVVVVGDAVRLEVKVAGKPEPTIVWMKDGQELTPRVKVHRVTGDNIHSLGLQNVRVKDSGVYTCRAFNQKGEALDEGLLTVKEPEAPGIDGMVDQEAKLGAPAGFTVTTTGVPIPTVRWLRKGKEVKSTEDVTLSSDDKARTYSLSIKSLSEAEAGSYSCEASNCAGTVTKEAKLIIQPERPSFLQVPQDLLVPLGQKAKFLVKVNGYPAPHISWLRDGTEVVEGKHYQTVKLDEPGSFVLEIASAKPSDVATFTCVAKNLAGEASCSASLQIEDIAPTIKVQLPPSLTIKEGKQLRLEGLVDGQPMPKVSWLKDGQTLSSDNRVDISTTKDGQTTLLLDDAVPQDAGKYTLLAKNAKGQAQSTCSVTVEGKIPRSKPRFIKELESISTIPGQSIILTAKVEGNPKPSITWLKDGDRIGSEALIREEPDGTLKLSIEKARADHTGKYQVTATNPLGEAISSATLSIKAPLSKPAFEAELQPTQLQEGEPGKLVVKFTGNPVPAIKWYKDGKELAPSERVTMKMQDGRAALLLDNVVPEDAGLYMAILTNDQGQARTEAPVGVLEAIKPEAKKGPTLPEILEPLTPMLLTEGEPAILRAKVGGDPNVSWLKNGKPLSPSEHIRFFHLPDGSVGLQFDKVAPEDAGRYTLEASLGDHVARSEAKISTTCGPIKVSGNKPEFLKMLEPVTVAEGEPITLTAQVKDATAIKWLKDGEEIAPSERVEMSQSPDGTVKLTIVSAVPEDAGKYAVVATNPEGKTRSSAPVNVKGLTAPRQKPEIIKHLEPLILNEGQSGKLEGQVSGEPKPLIKWLHNGETVLPSSRVIPQWDPTEGRAALVFDKALPKDAGKYTLVAANEDGEVRSVAPLTVNQPPIFIVPLEGKEGVEGAPAKLQCQVTGVPTPTVHWSKDGRDIVPDNQHLRIASLPDGTQSLVIDKCVPGDGGIYTCTATNQHGSDSTDSPFTVSAREVEGEPRIPPKFVTPLTNVSVRESEPFHFEATVTGNPRPDVSWLLDDQPILPSKNVIPSFDGSKVRLEVRESNPQHSGLYECQLVNPEGDVSSRARATVLPRTPPEFIQTLVDMEMPTRDPLKLICRVRGDPEPTIEWLYNGHKIEPGLKYSMTREGDRCILTLPWPRPQDSGVYQCRATNPVGSDSCKANITVSESAKRGEPPMFLKRLKNCDVIEGVPAKFTACITGSPTPEIKWFKNGEQLELGPRHKQDLDPSGVLRLVIKNIEPSDLGQYRLAISNPYGSDSCTATLSLEGSMNGERELPDDEKIMRTGPPNPLPDKPYIRRMSDHDLSLAWRPYIPRYPPRLPVTYEVEMSHLPDPTWKTYKSGLKDSCCDVTGLEPGKDYRFRVRVENKFGVSDPSPYVSAYRSKFVPPTPREFLPKDYEIEHPPLEHITAAPRFVRKEEDVMYGVRGQPVRIDFWVYGHPAPTITWHFKGQKVDGTKYDHMEDRNGQVILFITRMTDADVGDYSCHAVNELGEAWQKIKLLIAEPPIFLERLEESTVLVRGRVKMRCRVTGTPYPKIKWFKDWHPLSESSRITLTFIEPDTCILDLSSAILKDAGLYTCSASNIAGNASSSAILHVEESEMEYDIRTYSKPLSVKPKTKNLEDRYDVGDELGRGTQGITYHAVDRDTGKSYAVKSMQGTGRIRDRMDAEMDAMNRLSHPRLVRLWDAYEPNNSSLNLVTDLCDGGEVLDSLLRKPSFSEADVARYIRQVLEGLEHMHSKGMAHLGLTLGDILVTRSDGTEVKIADFGHATKLHPGRPYVQEYGHPEFVAPEVANKQPVSVSADMWSVGIITYILLTGHSPFLGATDRDTLANVQKGKFDPYYDGFLVLSDEARDFISKLLVKDPSGRLDVTAALCHPWLKCADFPERCEKLEHMDKLRDYSRHWRNWNANTACRKTYRRRPLDSCFTHPSRMLYPPGESYTPPQTPEPSLRRTRIKSAAFDDTMAQRISREPIDIRSESQYQAGPDTFLLPLRDPEFPVRVRQYLRIGSGRSPTLADHLKDKHWSNSKVTVRERRKFLDVLDEEIDDEKKGKDKFTVPFRLQREIGTLAETESTTRRKRSQDSIIGCLPYFREKLRDVVIREGEEVVMRCYAVGQPKPLYSWFRNDGILIESSRIKMTTDTSGRAELRLKPGKAYDMGMYKCVARNQHGVALCRARLKIGDIPGKTEPPKIKQCSASEVYVTWFPPKSDGNSTILCYCLEYKATEEENWTKALDTITHEFYVVRNLQPSTTYHFRVAARNKFGWGETSQPSEICKTLEEGSPKMKVTKANKFLLEMMDRGQMVIEDPEEEAPNLDYEVELNPVALEEGEPLELYNFISEVARGRFSLVARVWSKKLNTTLVAKVIQKTPNNESEVLAEFDAARSLRHERIASLLTASSHPSALILGMERLSGVDVLSYLSGHVQYSEQTVSHVVVQVLNGLEYLHFRGLGYLDLQPDNVVVVDGHRANIKLVDFGAVRCLPPEGARLHWKPRDLEYLAPELVKEEEVTYAADIWGVGVLTYILLSAKSPFRGDDPQETASNILYVRYRFDSLYRNCTQEAARFLMQLFKRTPQKRPSIEECLENKWLLPTEFLIRKREHAVFLTHRLHEFSEEFHARKQSSTPPALLSMFGMTLTKSVSLEMDNYEEL